MQNICYNTFCSAGVAHPVERHLAKVEVASSSLVTRSIKTVTARWLFFFYHAEAVLCGVVSPRLEGSNPTIRWIVGGEGLTEPIVYFCGSKNSNEPLHPLHKNSHRKVVVFLC